jgi:hypothetical protein
VSRTLSWYEMSQVTIPDKNYTHFVASLPSLRVKAVKLTSARHFAIGWPGGQNINSPARFRL